MKRFKLLVLAAATMILVLGLFQWASAADAKPLVIVQASDPTALDPTMRRELTTYNVTMNIFDSLFLRKSDGKIAPGLAASYEKKSPTVWELSLRKGVKFHNGEVFNAKAVKFTIDRILDPDTKSARRTGYTWIKSCSVVDDYTVTITTVQPYPLTLATLAELQIVPPGYLKEVGDAKFNEAPVGTGPYKFVSWKKDQSLELAANESYWRGAPAVKRVIFKPIPNETTRVASLLSGDADIIPGVTPALIPQISSSKTAAVESVTGARSIFVGFDMNQDTPLKNKLVRQAINYAVDVDAIIKALLPGSAERTATLLSPKDFGYSPYKPYAVNKTRAKKLLSDAGYKNGFTITMDVPNGRYVNDVEVAQAIAGELSKVGIKVKVNVREFASFNSDVFARKQAPMYFLGWGNPVFDADYILYSLLRTKELLSNYSNAKLDKLLDAAHNTISQEDRLDLYRQAQSIIKEEAPMLFLYKQKDHYGVSKRVQWDPRADEFMWAYDMKVK